MFRPGIAWRSTRHSVIIAGIFAATAAMIAPVGGLGVLVWTFLATIIVVAVYSRRPEARLSGPAGARLGAATGLAAFLAWVVLFLIAIFGLHQGPQLHDLVIKSTRDASVNYPSAQAAQIIDFVSSSHGFAIFVLLGIVLMLFFSVISGAVAGAISGALFSRSTR